MIQYIDVDSNMHLQYTYVIYGLDYIFKSYEISGPIAHILPGNPKLITQCAIQQIRVSLITDYEYAELVYYGEDVNMILCYRKDTVISNDTNHVCVCIFCRDVATCWLLLAPSCRDEDEHHEHRQIWRTGLIDRYTHNVNVCWIAPFSESELSSNCPSVRMVLVRISGVLVKYRRYGKRTLESVLYCGFRGLYIEYTLLHALCTYHCEAMCPDYIGNDDMTYVYDTLHSLAIRSNLYLSDTNDDYLNLINPLRNNHLVCCMLSCGMMTCSIADNIILNVIVLVHYVEDVSRTMSYRKGTVILSDTNHGCVCIFCRDVRFWRQFPVPSYRDEDEHNGHRQIWRAGLIDRYTHNVNVCWIAHLSESELSYNCPSVRMVLVRISGVLFKYWIDGKRTLESDLYRDYREFDIEYAMLHALYTYYCETMYPEYGSNDMRYRIIYIDKSLSTCTYIQTLKYKHSRRCYIKRTGNTRVWSDERLWLYRPAPYFLTIVVMLSEWYTVMRELLSRNDMSKMDKMYMYINTVINNDIYVNIFTLFCSIYGNARGGTLTNYINQPKSQHMHRSAVQRQKREMLPQTHLGDIYYELCVLQKHMFDIYKLVYNGTLSGFVFKIKQSVLFNVKRCFLGGGLSARKLYLERRSRVPYVRSAYRLGCICSETKPSVDEK